MKNFFYIQKKSISKNQCKEIIDWFEENTERHNVGLVGGPSGHVVRSNIKESIDITLTTDEDTIVNEIITSSLNQGFLEYQNEYPVLTATADWNVDVHFNIQKYNPGGGYKELHFEAANPLSSNRLFAWMIYLNSDWRGGTIFPYLNTKFRASAGTLLIWPASFTHSHKSQVTNKTKYIVTGWASFIDINN